MRSGTMLCASFEHKPWWTIDLGPKATTLDEIHAVLHFVVPSDKALHGPEFCRLLIQAVRQFIGPDEAKLLEQNMRNAKCKTKVVSPEARAKARLRAQGRDIARMRDGVPSPLVPKTSKKATELAEMRDQLNKEST